MFEVSLADLQNDEDQAFRKIKLRAEDVQGKNVLTNFWVSSLLMYIIPATISAGFAFNHCCMSFPRRNLQVRYWNVVRDGLDD